MEINISNNPLYGKERSLSSFLIVLILSFVAFNTVGPFLGILLSSPFLNFDYNKTLNLLLNPFDNPEARVPMLITQGVASAFGFIFIPWIYLKGKYRLSINRFFLPFQSNSLNLLALTGFIVISFMFVNSFFIEWNLKLELPEAWSGLENILRSFEESARKLTEQITQFDNTGQFLLAFVVIAIIPAIGEELLFRGILQSLLYNSLKNIHFAIWIAAFLFSAIHFQFFGFIPRMLLGALFGYIYLWSGNLTYPIIAHFINNGFTLVMIYLYHSELITYNIENSESAPISLVLSFTLITGILLFIFRKYNIND